MKISIITVCKNAEQFIEQTISSVLSQSYSNVEYILIDGKSSDQTLKIISKYKSNISYFVSEEDKSLYEALNKGIRAASGDIIGILHAGDCFVNNFVLEEIALLFTSNSAIDAIYSNVYFTNKAGKVTRKINAKNWKPINFSFGEMPPHPGFYCKKSVYEKKGFYLENYKIAADFELMVRFILNSNINYKYLPIYTVDMQIGGISNSGIKSYAIKTREILKSLQTNQIKANKFVILVRFLTKLKQFI